MATTPKGIYYPNDYNEIADIPKDMKKMAESIEEVFENTDSDLSDIKEEQTTQNNRLNSLEVDNTTNKSDILTNKQDINNIKTEQTTQNTNISTNATNIESLQEENENLKKIVNQLPQVEGQGTEVTLENTIEAQFTLFSPEGHSDQETTEGRNLCPTKSFESLSRVRIVSNSTEYGSTVQGIAVSAGTYTASFDVTTLPSSDYRMQLVASSDSTQSQSAVDITNPILTETKTFGTLGRKTLSITVEQSCYLYLRCVPAGFVLDNIQIEQGSATEYEKFTYGASPNPNYEQPIYSAGDNGTINEKIQTRNLFDGTREVNPTYTNSIKTALQNYKNTGKYATGYINNNNIIASDNRLFTGFTEIQSGETYTINNTYSATASFSLICFLDKDGNVISKNTEWSSQAYTHTATEEEKYIAVGAFLTSLNYIQIEPGSTATPYVPHEEQDYSIFVQQPMRSIGDVRDLFFKNTIDSPYYDENLTLNGWYERHYIGEYIANNDLPGNGMTDTLIGLLTPILNIAPGLTGINFTSIVRSNLLQNAIINNSGLGGTNGDSRIRVNLSKDFAKTFDEANAFLTNNKFKIEFVQKEPLDLPCTEEQIQQLENKPSTYKDFTIIQSEDKTEAYLEVSGIRDINTMFDKVTNAIVSLGGNV